MRDLLLSCLFVMALSAGLAAVLTAGVRHYRKQPVSAAEIARPALAGVLAGAVCGLIGQSLFLLLYRIGASLWLGRLLGFGVGGGLTGFLLGQFVPCLPPRRALAAGAVAALGITPLFQALLNGGREGLAHAAAAGLLGLAIALAVELPGEEALPPPPVRRNRCAPPWSLEPMGFAAFVVGPAYEIIPDEEDLESEDTTPEPPPGTRQDSLYLRWKSRLWK